MHACMLVCAHRCWHAWTICVSHQSAASQRATSASTGRPCGSPRLAERVLPDGIVPARGGGVHGSYVAAQFGCAEVGKVEQASSAATVRPPSLLLAGRTRSLQIHLSSQPPAKHACVPQRQLINATRATHPHYTQPPAVPAARQIPALHQVAVGEQHRVARLVGLQPRGVPGHHVGAVGEEGDATEALRLALAGRGGGGGGGGGLKLGWGWDVVDAG